jgi:hypothetical protein
VTVWTVALSVAIFTVIGFTLDAGRVLRARSDAFGTAAAAARRGVQEVDEFTEVGDGVVVLDEDAARAAALSYVHERGYEGTVTVNGLEVTVTVRGSVDPHMLGVGTLNIESTATAEAVQVGP